MFEIVSRDKDYICFMIFGKLFLYRYQLRKLTYDEHDGFICNSYWLVRDRDGVEFILHTFLHRNQYTRFSGLFNLIGRLLPPVVCFRRGYYSFGRVNDLLVQSLSLEDIDKKDDLDKEWIKDRGLTIVDRVYTGGAYLSKPRMSELADSLNNPDMFRVGPLGLLRQWMDERQI